MKGDHIKHWEFAQNGRFSVQLSLSFTIYNTSDPTMLLTTDIGRLLVDVSRKSEYRVSYQCLFAVASCVYYVKVKVERKYTNKTIVCYKTYRNVRICQRDRCAAKRSGRCDEALQ